MSSYSLKKQAAFIAGEWVEADKWIEVDDPATGSLIGRTPQLGADHATRAVEVAAAAMKGWSVRTTQERADILWRVHDLMRARRADLAALLTAEQGKPLAEAAAEIDYAASYFAWFAEEGKRAYGRIIPSPFADGRIMVLRQPVGVVAAITPWNFPAAMVTRKVAAALAAGCSIVLKPAEQTPFSALAIAALAKEAGVPDGVINVVTGYGPELGATFAADPRVRKISFTGSTPVGAHLFANSAATMKKLGLELGGNAAFILFPDADIKAAVEGAVAAKFRNAGQTCVCANRFLVHHSIHDSFVESFAQAVRGLTVGPGNDPASQIGPLIDSRALLKVEQHVAEAVALGGHVVCGGRRSSVGERFYEPTIITGARPEMRVMREETFGPVAPIGVFSTEAEAIAMANASEAGLAAYVYTRDLSRVWRVTEALETGIVGVNTGAISTAVAPFGGVKMSGLGREGGSEGLEDYLETKYVCMQLDGRDGGGGLQ